MKDRRLKIGLAPTQMGGVEVVFASHANFGTRKLWLQRGAGHDGPSGRPAERISNRCGNNGPTDRCEHRPFRDLVSTRPIVPSKN